MATTSRGYELKLENLTITFDHVDPKAEITASSGRRLRRGEDGFYHVAPGEWDCIRRMSGVTLIADDSK